MTAMDHDRGMLFEQHRPRLFGIAYRMLGSRSDAEDLVQETYLRWHQADLSELKSPQAWLTTVVTRLCIDRLRSAAVQREVYPGEWLPEPLVESAARPDHEAELSESLSVAFLLILERLFPDERAVFLLHEVFGEDYMQIARVLGKSEANCRQMAHRARERVRREKPRFSADPALHQHLLEGFRTALVNGDADELMRLFAEDATWTADGGGLAPAAPYPHHGRTRIVQLLMGLLRKQSGRLRCAIVPINGAPGLIVALDDQIAAAISFETAGKEIVAAYAVVNPEKLRGITFPENETNGRLYQ